MKKQKTKFLLAVVLSIAFAFTAFSMAGCDSDNGSSSGGSGSGGGSRGAYAVSVGESEWTLGHNGISLEMGIYGADDLSAVAVGTELTVRLTPIEGRRLRSGDLNLPSAVSISECRGYIYWTFTKTRGSTSVLIPYYNRCMWEDGLCCEEQEWYGYSWHNTTEVIPFIESGTFKYGRARITITGNGIGIHIYTNEANGLPAGVPLNQRHGQITNRNANNGNLTLSLGSQPARTINVSSARYINGVLSMRITGTVFDWGSGTDTEINFSATRIA
ncbi:MAG: hypothetical protein FWB72_07225 [Firmicutes bacterium]|nr:hypothetical protein [Bacillota bacterium]